MRKGIRWCLLPVLGACLTFATGCAAAPDSAAKTTKVNVAMIDAAEVRLYPVSVDDAPIPMKSLQAACKTLQKYLRGKLIIEKPGRMSMPKSLLKKHDMSGIRLNGHGITAAPNHIVLCFLPIAKSSHRGISLTFTDGWREINFDEQRVRHMSFPIFFTVQEAWQLVITHEMGHQLGVPANKSHKWKVAFPTNGGRGGERHNGCFRQGALT